MAKKRPIRRNLKRSREIKALPPILKLKFTDLVFFLWQLLNIIYKQTLTPTRKKQLKKVQKNWRKNLKGFDFSVPNYQNLELEFHPRKKEILQQIEEKKNYYKKVITKYMSKKKRQYKKVKKSFKKTLLVRQKSGVIFAHTQISLWRKAMANREKKYRAYKRKFNTKLKQYKKKFKKISKIIDKELIKILTPKKKRGGKSTRRKSKKSILIELKQVFTSLRFQAVISIIFSIFILGSSYFIYDFVFKDLPTTEDLLEHKPIVSTKIVDRNGVLLYNIYKDENRTLVPLDEISPYLIQATIAIEDKNFYNHIGFDLKGIIRAFIANQNGESKSIQGGSTITQQLVKNTLLSRERTIKRKIREILVAITVDGSFSKDQILEMYLNEVAFGGSTYGIEEASRRYFGKHASELSLAESAMLAGLPQAPSLYSPFGSHPERAYTRQAQVLTRMVEDNYITEEQAVQARKEVLKFKNDVIDIKAPHFVMYVRELLAEKYGDELMSHGGLIVKTSLDYNLQQESEKIIRDELESLARLRVSNGSGLITNPKTGEVLSMVGSKNYFDFEHDGQVNVSLRPRQPGSSIKPITYALALERGKTPSSIIDDSPVTYQIAGSKPYSPNNYDGRFHGKVPLRTALASSYNIPAVKLLAEVGINNMIDKAQEMGISTWDDRSRFGLSLTLGGGEIKMIDMNKVYGSFANMGYSVDINPILEVSTYDGEILYKNTCALEKVACPKKKTLDEKVAAQINSILSDNAARTPAFGPRSIIYIPEAEVAVKTGTTNSLRDNWTIGYTSDRVVSVWVGNNDNTPMSYIASGITGASPIWNDLMRLTL
ncbi:MAG: PBP1A family penicillin-binding protein, partial [Patescibacteria group bacterium]